VRQLRALHFRKPCEVQGCAGCASCRCALELKDIKVSPDAKAYYALLAEAQRLAGELATEAEAARGLLLDGTRTLAARAASLEETCPTARGRQLARELRECMAALNPGEMDSPGAPRDGKDDSPRVVGWWTEKVKLKRDP